jgi:uncharacterized protein YpuA (DUF1002 family)
MTYLTSSSTAVARSAKSDVHKAYSLISRMDAQEKDQLKKSVSNRLKKVGRKGYATEEERQAARRAASRRQTEKRRACRIPVASEPGPSTAKEPEPRKEL